MATTTPDALAQKVFDLLSQSPSKPLGLLSVLDHDMLPVVPDELPAVGVYLVEDQPEAAPDTYGTGSQARVATIRVEIRVKVPVGTRPTEEHRPLREWVAAVLMADESLGGLANHLARGAYAPYSLPADHRLAGADLDFDAFYFSRPA